MTETAITVHGLGYVGLTAAVHYARAGWTVTGYDPDPAVVAALNAGHPKAEEFLAYTGAEVATLVAAQRLRATTEFAEATRGPVHLIAVPSERNGDPAMEIVDATLDALWEGVPPEGAILVESTLTPGTLARAVARHGGPPAFALAATPRRDWFADPAKNLATLPRVVGGITPGSTARAVAIVEMVSKTLLPTTAAVAELTKPLENALLHVPVMLAHELALAYPEADVAAALALATTHWRLTPLYLNFGTGGRCVPLGAKYLVAGAPGPPERGMEIARGALRLEGTLRAGIAEWATRVAGKGAIVVLGIAYRPGFRDAGSSPGRDIARRCVARGARVAVHDPLWSPAELEALTGAGAGPLEVLLPRAAVVLLATPHPVYAALPEEESLWAPGTVVLEAQGTWNTPASLAAFRRSGVTYTHVGRPGWRDLPPGAREGEGE